MAVHDSTAIWDGFASTAGGMDGGRQPDLIGDDQCEFMQNVVNRGGSVKTRPGFKQLISNIENPFFSYNANGFIPGSGVIGTRTIDVLSTGLFQGASYYAPPGGEECIMASIGGRLFRFIPRTTYADIREIPLPDKRNRDTIPLAYMVQADRYHITQDGESSPIIFDGVTARRATSTEVPVGTLMAYGMGRLIVVRPSSREVLFGDLIGSHPGTYPGESVLQFTETTFLAEGGSASIPFSLGEITAAIFYPQQDTVSGQGELLIFCEKGMASFFLSLPREQWKESNFQRLGLLDIGGMGHRAFTSVNEDIWFRSKDGWRSYRQARAEWKGWAQIPMSTEVRRYIENDTQSLLKYASAIHFDNRLIATCTPIPNKGNAQVDPFGVELPTGRLFHNGFLVLDFDVLSAFGESVKPAWDGHWHKIRTYQLVSGTFNGKERAFAFGMTEESGVNSLFEITKNDIQDFDGLIVSTIDGRALDFEQPFNEKELSGGSIWWDNVRAETNVDVYYKPDSYPTWIPWMTSIGPCAHKTLDTIGNCLEVTCGGCPTVRPGFSPRTDLINPEDLCDSTTSRVTRLGYSFQPRIRWTGNARIRKFRAKATVKTESKLAQPQT